jgi:putative acetyltransferase
VIRIIEDDLSGTEIGALLEYHLSEMHRSSPPGSVFAFDIARLRAPDVTFWSAWIGSDIAGCGAIKDLGDRTGEIKSMRTAPSHLRKGVAAKLVEHLVDTARARGMTRLSLETGSGPAFDPALALYRRHGFVDGDAFGSYSRSNFNQFLHLEL